MNITIKNQNKADKKNEMKQVEVKQAVDQKAVDNNAAIINAKAEKARLEAIATLKAIGIDNPSEVQILVLVGKLKTTTTKKETVHINSFQHALVKDIMDACKVYHDAAGTIVPEKIKVIDDKTGKEKSVINPDAVSYSFITPHIGVFNSFSDIQEKIGDIVSWFKPNASKTGKACTTPENDCQKIAEEVYKTIIAEMYSSLSA